MTKMYTICCGRFDKKIDCISGPVYLDPSRDLEFMKRPINSRLEFMKRPINSRLEFMKRPINSRWGGGG